MKEILALNCGSSSLKYAVFDASGETRGLHGEVARIGSGGATDHAAAVSGVMDELAKAGVTDLGAVGHRLVHGGPHHAEPELVDEALLASLDELVPYAPLHLPPELRAIRAVSTRFAGLPQVVCFDTAFHATLPEIARRFALPSSLFDSGVRRYGFHGLSYEYVVESLGASTLGRAVVAHLGNGSSMTALLDGRSVDTTMGFTPTAGLVMGTRAGDLDPGLLVYLLEHRGYDAHRLDRLVNNEAGLLALSGSTSDMKSLLEKRASGASLALRRGPRRGRFRDRGRLLLSGAEVRRRARSRGLWPRDARVHGRDRRARAGGPPRDLPVARAPRRRPRRRSQRGVRAHHQQGRELLLRACRRDRRGAHDRAPYVTAAEIARLTGPPLA
jgi:acetate kinase